MVFEESCGLGPWYASHYIHKNPHLDGNVIMPREIVHEETFWSSKCHTCAEEDGLLLS